ncbi:NAD(+) salvage pathway protein [Serendipita sp. 401]|nr:NAD(+) salvage pathway protein [Serendipita sp. 401]
MAASSNKTALILVDIQHDFLPPDGSLAVTDGDQILPPVYRLIENAEKYFDLVVASLDYHPVSHISFASTHGKEPFTTLEVPKLNSNETITQMLWPDHCVQGTKGCELEPGIMKRLERISHMVEYIQKGDNVAVDAYSAFADNQYTFFTPLARILHAAGVTKVVVCGLATDYCVRATAIDARKFGFETKLLTDAVRAVDPTKETDILSELEVWGCQLVESGSIV